MTKEGCPAGQVWFRGKCVDTMYRAHIEEIGHADDLIGYGKTPGEALRMCKKAHSYVINGWKPGDQSKKQFLASLEDHQRDFARAFEYYGGSIEVIVPGYSEANSFPVDGDYDDPAMEGVRPWISRQVKEEDWEWVRRKLKER